MEHHTFSFLSASDGLRIAGLYIVPEKKPYQGIVQLVHGMAEHKERYLPFMEELSKHGYICVITDHRGHGESVKHRKDLGYFYDTSGEAVVEDIHQLTMMMRNKLPDLPFLLFGHSMGSLIVRKYCKRYDRDIDALVVCGSPSRNPMAGIAKKLVRGMKKVKGDHHRSALIQKLAFGSFAKNFPEQDSENVWLCSDPLVVKAYDEDPLCGFVFTLNGFENLFSIMSDVYDPNGWSCTKAELPILFIAGSKDPCITSEEQFAKAHGFMKEVGYRDVEHHLFEGRRHEILNEDIKEDVYAYVFEWMSRKMPRKEEKN